MKLDPSASALDAFTDFRRDAPLSVDVECPVSHALTEMTRLGAHSLLVTRHSSTHTEPLVVGFVTCAGLERCSRRAGGHVSLEIVMTPWHELPLVHVESLQWVSALDMYERFQGTGLTHVLVVEEHGKDCGAGARSRLPAEPCKASAGHRRGRSARPPYAVSRHPPMRRGASSDGPRDCCSR